MVDGCFLCRPEPDLVYFRSAHTVALAGLGPIGPGYSVLSVDSHLSGAADLPAALKLEFLATVNEIRGVLSDEFGNCTITEHGRMPVCVADEALGGRHCFHAHFLGFPGVAPFDALAVPYFARATKYERIEAALEAARTERGEYFLISSRPDRVLLLREPLQAAPQFARGLAAAAHGVPHERDWKENPNPERAAQIAVELRSLFGAERTEEGIRG